MSTVQVANITDGTNSVETVYVARGSAKAWVNFNGTGTIAARDSLNLSSLTDGGTGDYTVNFSNAFDAGNYAISGAVTGSVLGGNGSGATFASPHNAVPSVSALRSLTYASNTLGAYDSAQLTLSIHGDLA